MNKQNSNFSESLFWDCDLQPRDYSKYSSLIVDRVVHRGDLDDWNLMKSILGIESIKEELLKLKYINPKILRSMSKLFDIPVSEFRCYKLRGAMPRHWWEK